MALCIAVPEEALLDKELRCPLASSGDRLPWWQLVLHDLACFQRGPITAVAGEEGPAPRQLQPTVEPSLL
eukprot:12901657-Prorocentrum_lima.AAC.1